MVERACSNRFVNILKIYIKEQNIYNRVMVEGLARYNSIANIIKIYIKEQNIYNR